MIRFLARRLVTVLLLMLIMSFGIYGMLMVAIDPLEDLRTSPDPNKETLIAQRIAFLHLDEPWYQRYWRWLTQFLQGNPGLAWQSQQKVSDIMLGQSGNILDGAIGQSIQLVFMATVLALLLGVSVGVVSALRQYTTFDYAITFISFVLFALPVFWVAVLLKQFLAIKFNDFLQEPAIVWPAVIGLSLAAALFWMGALGGDLRRKVIVFTSALLVTGGSLVFIFTTGWLQKPVIGRPGFLLIGLACAFLFTMIIAGLHNRRALYSAITTVLVGLGTYYGLQWFFFYYEVNNTLNLMLLALALVIGALIGFLFGGPDRGQSIKICMLVALVLSVVTWFDQLLQVYPEYLTKVGGRPVPTLGSTTPNFQGDYWLTQLDKLTHILLPTIALVLISFAGYVRYERGATLEVLNQDYIRTARSKGLPERVVIVRHALRNALMPLASLVPGDFIAMIGGAVLTETIFGWQGMGRMFISALNNSEADPIMAYLMITGALAMVANIIADILYAVLDPRIRVNA